MGGATEEEFIKELYELINSPEKKAAKKIKQIKQYLDNHVNSKSNVSTAN